MNSDPSSSKAFVSRLFVVRKPRGQFFSCRGSHACQNVCLQPKPHYISKILDKRICKCKIVNNFFYICFGVQKKNLIEKVLLNTHNTCLC